MLPCVSPGLCPVENGAHSGGRGGASRDEIPGMVALVSQYRLDLAKVISRSLSCSRRCIGRGHRGFHQCVVHCVNGRLACDIVDHFASVAWWDFSPRCHRTSVDRHAPDLCAISAALLGCWTHCHEGDLSIGADKCGVTGAQGGSVCAAGLGFTIFLVIDAPRSMASCNADSIGMRGCTCRSTVFSVNGIVGMHANHVVERCCQKVHLPHHASRSALVQSCTTLFSICCPGIPDLLRQQVFGSAQSHESVGG
mmetsp:Transcript_28867/g.69352  ORF Transcript_28867/g.69352 Transcript_28867/m.69352 type:complete len:252 (+) Transcript_28867:2641-3396(+)